MAVTVVPTEYGFEASGAGTATINDGKIWVRALGFAAADDATVVFTSLVNGTATSCYKFKINGNDTDASMFTAYFGEKGVPMTGLAVTSSAAANVLYVFIR